MIQRRFDFGEALDDVPDVNRHSELPRDLRGGKQTTDSLTRIALVGFDHHCVLSPRALEGSDDLAHIGPKSNQSGVKLIPSL